MNCSTPVPADTVRLLSIDAWRDGDGWTWNNWHHVAFVPLTWCDYTARELFKAMRRAGYLAHDSGGQCVREDDQYNVVICARGSRMPVYALAYGEVQS